MIQLVKRTELLRLFQEKEAVKSIVGIAWPAMIESFFVALTVLIDEFMISDLGEYAIAAVGLTMQPKYIAISPFLAVSVAVNALTARRKGQGRREDAHRILQVAVLFACFGAVLIGVACAILAGPLMTLVGSEAVTHEAATTYFRIVTGFIVFHVITLSINAAQRGSGRANLSMRTNLVSSAVNVAFNWLLIGGNLGFPALGVAGAAIATVLGSMAACAMSLCSLFSKDSFLSVPYMRRANIRANRETVGSVANIASSVLVENLLMRMGFMATAVMAARLGTQAMAAHNVGLNLLTLSFSIGDGIQVAAVSLIGQSLGQERPDLARRYGSLCQQVGLVASACMTVLYLLGGQPLYRMFFPDSPLAVAHGVMICRCLIVVIIIQISQVVYLGSLRGAGDIRYVTLALIVSVTLVRAGSGFLFCEVLGMGLIGLWLSIIADQISRFLFTSIRFRQGKWTELTL